LSAQLRRSSAPWWSHVLDRRVLALCWLACVGGIVSAARPVQAQTGDPIKVLVAVLPFQVNSSRPLAHLETSIAD